MAIQEVVAVLDAVKWPTLVFGTVLLFKSRIGSLLDGLRNRPIKHGETQIGVEQQNQPTLSGPSSSPAIATKTIAIEAKKGEPATFLFEEQDNPYITEVASVVRKNVEDKRFGSEEERNSWLYREGAKLEIRVEFEQLYRTLFQSQLSVLLAANASINRGGLTDGDVRQGYDEAVQRNPEYYGAYPYENWLGYVTRNGLLIQGGNGWVITYKGQLYLMFLVQYGYGVRALASL